MFSSEHSSSACLQTQFQSSQRREKSECDSVSLTPYSQSDITSLCLPHSHCERPNVAETGYGSDFVLSGSTVKKFGRIGHKRMHHDAFWSNNGRATVSPGLKFNG